MVGGAAGWERAVRLDGGAPGWERAGRLDDGALLVGWLNGFTAG